MILLQGDCLEQYKNIEKESVDLILVDPPYGNMLFDLNQINKGKSDKNGYYEWDNVLDFKKMFELCDYILRPSGRLIMFCSGSFLFDLYNNAPKNISYNYKLIWNKEDYGNFLGVNKFPAFYTEDMLVFTKRNDTYDVRRDDYSKPTFPEIGVNPIRAYMRNLLTQIPGDPVNVIKTLGGRVTRSYAYNAIQFGICTKSTYDALIEHYNIDTFDGYREYEDIKAESDEYKYKNSNLIKERFPVVFNLNGKNNISNIFTYKRPSKPVHPTQKPIGLLEDLIKIYSNEGDIVCDFTMGSGSTGVASINTNRDFIGIEMDQTFFDIAKKRINNNG